MTGIPQGLELFPIPLLVVRNPQLITEIAHNKGALSAYMRSGDPTWGQQTPGIHGQNSVGL